MKTIHTRLVVNKASVVGAGGTLGREDEVREAPAESTELCSPLGFILNDAEQTLQDFESSDRIRLRRPRQKTQQLRMVSNGRDSGYVREAGTIGAVHRQMNG